MFSERTRWPATPNRWSALRAEREARGDELLDLTESNPTRVGLAYPAREILGALADPRSLVYEAQPLGLRAAREAVAAAYQAEGHSVGPDRILITSSTSEAYGYLFKLLTDPGDGILIPRPGYPLLEELGGLESLEGRFYALDPDGGWSLDPEALASAGGERTRAVVLVNPGNPTGAYLKGHEWEELQDLCRARGWAVISDEVFSAYPASEDPDRVACAASGARVLTFSLGGLSKWGLPQLKLGWVALGGPEEEVSEAIRRLEMIADAYLSVSTPVQVAAPRLLAAIPGMRDQIRRRLDANRRHLEARTAGTPCRPLPSEGGWYAIVRPPATRTGEEWALELLARDGVLVQPGYLYDLPGEAYLVVSLLPREDVFAEGVGRMVARIGEGSRGGVPGAA